MNTGDFSSIVQLGVGLHLGTALLQMYGEIGLQPMIRSIERLNDVVQDIAHPVEEELQHEFNELIGLFDIFKINMFVEYKKFLVVNSIVAMVLVALLVAMAFTYDTTIVPGWGVVVVAISILPAPITLFALWHDANTELAPLLKRADDLSQRMIG